MSHTEAHCSSHPKNCLYHSYIYNYAPVTVEEHNKITNLYNQFRQVSKEMNEKFYLHPTVENKELMDLSSQQLHQIAATHRSSQILFDSSDEGFAQLYEKVEQFNSRNYTSLDVLKTRLRLARWFTEEREQSELRLKIEREKAQHRVLLPGKKVELVEKSLTHEVSLLKENITWKTTSDLRLRENFFISANETVLSVKAIFDLLSNQIVSFGEKHNLQVDCCELKLPGSAFH